MSFTIRPLDNTAEDHAQWLELWHGYLAFYESQVSAETTAHNWAGFHDPNSPLDALAAFDAEGKMLGIAQTVMHESTWSVAPRCYLNDLYVRTNRVVYRLIDKSTFEVSHKELSYSTICEV